MNSKILILAILAIAVGFLHAQDLDNSKKPKLYCFSCNANLDSCNDPFQYRRFIDYLVPCNGQCMKFRNPNDNGCKMIQNL